MMAIDTTRSRPRTEQPEPEPEEIRETFDINRGVVQREAWLSEPVRPAIEYVDAFHVVVHEDAMTVDRPYPYLIGPDWLVAIRRADGSIDVYSTTF